MQKTNETATLDPKSTSAKATDVVEVAIGSAQHSTLVSAVKAADLVATLKGKGPFTVFAPTNKAFEKLPSGKLDELLKPDAKKDLSGLLTYHAVAGEMDAQTLSAAIKTGHGKTSLTTVNGAKLTASLDGDKVVITDAKGCKALVTAADLKAGNGVVHVIDTVLMP